MKIHFHPAVWQLCFANLNGMAPGTYADIELARRVLQAIREVAPPNPRWPVWSDDYSPEDRKAIGEAFKDHALDKNALAAPDLSVEQVDWLLAKLKEMAPKVATVNAILLAGLHDAIVMDKAAHDAAKADKAT